MIPDGYLIVHTMKFVPNDVAGTWHNRNHTNANVTFSRVGFMTLDETQEGWCRVFIEVVNRTDLINIATPK